MASSVWVQLYNNGGNKIGEQPFEICDLLQNIYGLKVAVKDQFGDHLAAAAPQLILYPVPQNPAVPVPKDTKPLNPWETVPANSSGPNPLIVVAPLMDGSQPKAGELHFCYRDLAFLECLCNMLLFAV